MVNIGRIRAKEIKKASFLLIEKYPDRFSNDFEKNKTALNGMNIIAEKKLKNRIAGYIAREINIKNRAPVKESPTEPSS